MSGFVTAEQVNQGSGGSAVSSSDVPSATRTLLETVRRFLTNYVVLPSDEAADALALWVLHTHALEATEVTPYFIVLSPERRSGKTLLLDVLQLLVRSPWHLASASEAAMFRKIQTAKPTLLLDEVDAIFGPSNSERTEALRGVLNAGNRRGAAVARCVGKGSEQQVVDFSVFCPKLLAGIDTGRLPDTIRDRGIELRMKRKAAGETVQRFRRRDVEPKAATIARLLEAWAAPAGPVLSGARPDLPEVLNDRTADAWEPLFAIADLGGWGERARHAAVVLAGQAVGEETSHGTQLLAKVRLIFAEHDAVQTDEILQAINEDDELPFGGWRHGGGLDARGLSRLLKPYGVKPKTIRFGDKTAKGYHLDAGLQEAFDRYLPSSRQGPSHPEHPSHTVRGVTGRPDEQTSVTDVTHVTLLSEGDGSCPKCDGPWQPADADGDVSCINGHWKPGATNESR